MPNEESNQIVNIQPQRSHFPVDTRIVDFSEITVQPKRGDHYRVPLEYNGEFSQGLCDCCTDFGDCCNALWCTSW